MATLSCDTLYIFEPLAWITHILELDLILDVNSTHNFCDHHARFRFYLNVNIFQRLDVSPPCSKNDFQTWPPFWCDLYTCKVCDFITHSSDLMTVSNYVNIVTQTFCQILKMASVGLPDTTTTQHTDIKLDVCITIKSSQSLSKLYRHWVMIQL